MKKLLVFLVVLVLMCASALAEGGADAVSIAKAQGFQPSAAPNPDGALFCDYTAASSSSADMTWSDEKQIYAIEGDPQAVAQVYVDALALGGWDSCRYIVGKKARVSYGVQSKHTCETLDEYLEQMQAALDVAPSDAAASPKADAVKYVLNTNTKKFHYPTCSSVGQMKQKNRRDYTGSRDDLISQGYDPCKRCKP